MELNFKTFGQGPAIVILHGLFGSLDNWVTHARTLSENFSVYIVDQRNHGKSFHSPQWDYPTMAKDLNHFLDQHGIFQTHLLGHSMGGKTVMQFAMDHPQRIDKLMVIDIAPVDYEPHHDELLEALIHFDLKSIGSRQEADEQLGKKIKDPGVRQFLLKSLGRDEDKNFTWKFNLEVIYEKYPNVLKGIDTSFGYDGSTLFLYGEKSNYINPNNITEIQEDFTNATFRKIPGAGHWVHADAPELFIREIQDFLQAS